MSGRQVREARRQRGWNQQELARQLEVSQGYVSLMERGEGRFLNISRPNSCHCFGCRQVSCPFGPPRRSRPIA